MGPRTYVELRLELEIDAEPITGRVRLGGAAPRPFSGWLGLAAALEDALTTSPQPLDVSGANAPKDT